MASPELLNESAKENDEQTLNENTQNGHSQYKNDYDDDNEASDTSSNEAESEYDPKSPAGIALRAFALGTTFGLSTTFTLLLLLLTNIPLWRAPFFLAALSFFHFLEYYITAVYNPPLADTSAFLLSANGRAYNIAHGAALAECVLTSLLAPAWQARISNAFVIALGLAAIAVGQGTRSMAMAHAGRNFNHLVQTRRADGHELVTDGIYGVLRHPSYAGFFWWGLGTQLVLGNAVCLVGYAYVLWRFFSHRIAREEELLVVFFGRQYEEYRKRTWACIPFIA